jgi:uncharacterized membrane protein HdeD (DUF308 family)
MTEPQFNPSDPAGPAGGVPGSGQGPGSGPAGSGPAGRSAPGQGSGSRSGQVPDQGRTAGSSPAGGAGGKPAGASGSGAAQSQYGVATQERMAAGRGSVPAQGQPDDIASSTTAAERGASEGRGSGGMASRMLKLGWVPVLLAGLGMIAVGVMLLVWPKASLTVVAILIGAALVVAGAMRLWEGFTAHSDSGGMRAASIIIGILAIIAGLYCLRHHTLTVFLVAFVIGVFWVVHGIAELALAFTPGVPGRGLRAVVGLISIAAGIVLIVWPSISVVLLLTITAAWLLFYGAVLLGLSWQVHKMSAAVRSELDTPQGRLAT